MARFRVEGLWLLLCLRLMPLAAPFYESCLGHILLAEEETRCIGELETRYGRRDLADEIRKYRALDADPDAANPAVRARSGKRDTEMRFAQAFCECVEQILLCAVLFVTPIVAMYVKSTTPGTQHYHSS
jgi:hypothetical protein